jgi:hypothetical protein
MKRLLEETEYVNKDSLMGQLLYHACPHNVYDSHIWGKDVKVFHISLHCFEFVVECVDYNNGWLIIKTEKEYI